MIGVSHLLAFDVAPRGPPGAPPAPALISKEDDFNAACLHSMLAIAALHMHVAAAACKQVPIYFQRQGGRTILCMLREQHTSDTVRMNYKKQLAIRDALNVIRNQMLQKPQL